MRDTDTTPKAKQVLPVPLEEKKDHVPAPLAQLAASQSASADHQEMLSYLKDSKNDSQRSGESERGLHGIRSGRNALGGGSIIGSLAATGSMGQPLDADFPQRTLNIQVDERAVQARLSLAGAKKSPEAVGEDLSLQATSINHSPVKIRHVYNRDHVKHQSTPPGAEHQPTK